MSVNLLINNLGEYIRTRICGSCREDSVPVQIGKMTCNTTNVSFTKIKEFSSSSVSFGGAAKIAGKSKNVMITFAVGGVVDNVSNADGTCRKNKVQNSWILVTNSPSGIGNKLVRIDDGEKVQQVILSRFVPCETSVIDPVNTGTVEVTEENDILIALTYVLHPVNKIGCGFDSTLPATVATVDMAVELASLNFRQMASIRK